MYARFVKCAVKYELGDAVESVVDSLLAHGHQRLDQLITNTQMPPLHVKKALMILIRHEMVNITMETIKTKKPSTSSAPPKTRSIYELNPDVIVQRNRFALYLVWVREKWGNDGEAIMQALAQHGKLPARQAIDLACAYLRQQDEKTDEKSLSLLRQRLDVIFRSLIAANVIKRALNFSDRQRLQQQQSLSLLQQLQADEVKEKEEAKKKSTTPKSTKKRKATDDDDKDDAPAPKTFKKLRRIKDTDDDTPSTPPVPTSSLPPITTTEMEDTKTQTTDDDSSGEEAQWSISHDEFTSQFRIKAIIEYVTERINPTAGHIIRVLMDNYPADMTQKPIFNLEQINDLYQSMDGVPELTLATLEQYCEEMAQDSIGILDRVPEGFMINKSKMFDELKTKHIQSVAREKHGQLGGRILRLLLVNKKLEEAQIAELATAPKKTTRETLYAMLKSNFLTLSEVPRSADRQPARSFFLWGVPREQINTLMLDSYYFAWCNLRVRQDLEHTKIKPLLDKVDTSKPLTKEEQSAIHIWQQSNERMQAGLLKLDQLIMLFKEF